MNRLAILGLLAALLAAAARADEKSDKAEKAEILAKQKAAAETLWKKMEFKDAAAPVETANMLVYSRMPEAKTKALAESLEKLFTTALKPLGFDADDRPWSGKLTVYVVPDRSEFVDIMRKAFRKGPGEEDGTFSKVAGEDAMMIVGAPRLGEAQSEEAAKRELAKMLLRKKNGGADPPGWLSDGFAKATAFRAANKTGKAVPSAPSVPFKELWYDKLPPAVKTKLATYLVDYLAYGPAPDAFASFVSTVREGENGAMPMWKEAYDSIKMSEPVLEAYARAWKKPPTPKTPKPKPEKKEK